MHGKVLLWAPLCHKEPARSKQNKIGVFCVPKPLVGGFGCDELVLYVQRRAGVETLRKYFNTLKLSTNESAPLWSSL